VLQVVCIKQVADTETRVKVAADGRSLDPAGVTWITNPYDEFALEQALRFKEAQGSGEVVALSLGGAGVTSTLRNVLAIGADRAIHLKVDAVQPDPLQVARALADELKALNADIVWFGKQAIDDDQAQVPAMVAELLQRPAVTVVAAIALGNGAARVEREVEGGREVIAVPLPAVFSSDKGLNEPRYASLKGIMAAKKKPIEETTMAALGVTATQKTRMLSVEAPPARKAGIKVASVDELVAKLHNEAKVI